MVTDVNVLSRDAENIAAVDAIKSSLESCHASGHGIIGIECNTQVLQAEQDLPAYLWLYLEKHRFDSFLEFLHGCAATQNQVNVLDEAM